MRNESMNLSKNEMMMVMHDQEQEIEKLKSQVAELQAKLDGYEIKVSESGNLAEAAAKVSGLFEAAQLTVDTYLENMKKRDEQAEAAFSDVQKQAEQRMDLLISQIAGKDNVDERLKEQDPLLWTARMNNIRQSAEEIVQTELIYS